MRGWVDRHRHDIKDLNHWMENQTYLAVGVMVIAAEWLGIDAIRLENSDSRVLDTEWATVNRGSHCQSASGFGLPCRIRFPLTKRQRGDCLWTGTLPS